MAAEYRVTVSDALTKLPGAQGERFAEVLKHGTLAIEIYAPQGHDPQNPHTRDEVYVIVSGSGTFRNGANLHPFASGDVLFVPAGVVHRFEEFSPDFVTWVIFYGPEGGEATGT